MSLDEWGARKATMQLGRSERGQLTCKQLSDFLESATVKGLDGPNSEAVTALVARYMLGTASDASAVRDALKDVIERNQWVLVHERKEAA